MTLNGSRILMLVDDEPAQLRLISALAQRAGWRTVTAASADVALARLSSRDGAVLDAILIDSSAGDVSELIAALRSRRASIPILLLTATNSVDHAVAAMRAGASDFLVKPIAPERLIAALDMAVKQGVDGGELRALAEKMPAAPGFDTMVGAAPRFRAALATAAKAARGRAPIVIEGESGVGKELLAHSIHDASGRRDAPFVVVHCGAVSGNLVESCLFGHEQGAFTGAFDRQAGKLQEANGGTIFLDQIDALPREAQAKLLDYMLTGEAAPIGGQRARVDARLLVASDQPLLGAVESDEFRSDLYHRLATVHATLPPLRERSGDIPALCHHMLARIAEQPGLRELDITDEALALLQGYDWPGNVRQLQAALFRAAVLCDTGTLTAGDFPQIASRRSNSSSTGAPAGVTIFDGEGHLRSIDAIEADIIRLAISHYRGRMTEVARRLGIGRSTLYRKLAELGISEAA